MRLSKPDVTEDVATRDLIGGARAAADRAQVLAAQGYVFDPQILSGAAAAFHRRGLDDTARTLDVLEAPRADPVCQSASR